ncbi:MAG: hypothetical protein AABW80_01420 [Nanoarchaeota archaeon]
MTRRGQVWIETVLYTLIGLALIGMVLAFALPKINQTRDEIIVDQTIESLKELDNLINGVADQGPGNRRTYEIGIKRGSLTFNSEEDIIEFRIKDLADLYSEEGIEIENGRVKILSSSGQKDKEILLSLDYENKINISYAGRDEIKEFSAAPIPYKLSVTNERQVVGELVNINIEAISGSSN